MVCNKCTLDKYGRRRVIGDGDPRSPVLFLGEAPGQREDEVGRPFQGRSGVLLRNTMTEVGIDWHKVFITNTIQCRPPENRKPTANELHECRVALDWKLEDRESIVCIGLTAARVLLGRDIKMSDVVNVPKTIELNGEMVDVLVVYHPAAVLRNPHLKAKFMEGMRLAKGLYDYSTGVPAFVADPLLMDRIEDDDDS